MKIKRQKQIRNFLVEEFGEEKGQRLFDRQDRILGTLIESQKGKSKSQMKTLIQTILPSIALYKCLLEGMSEDEAYEYMKRYMFDKVGAEMHSSMEKMEMVPGFFAIYGCIFRKIMRTSDLHVSTQASGKGYFDINITKCLWHIACVENGCANLCRLFCDADHVTYGGLKKIDFTRTKTLGYGEDCCDFHYFKK